MSLRTVEPARYRWVIGHFATGVCVITVEGPRGPVGMTANAVCSVSLEPLLLLVCFDRSARTLPIVRETRRFGVNVLSADQRDLAGLFASKTPEEEKFAGVAHRLHDGVPVLESTLAWVGCDLTELVDAGDHVIALGAVRQAEAPDVEREPLLWYRGGYGTVAPSGGRLALLSSTRYEGADDGRAEVTTGQGQGVRDDPWVLSTPPGTSEYTMYRDESADPPALVCQVGKTTLSYRLRCLEDLATMLKEHGDWIALGSADENKPAAAGTVEAWARSESNPVGGWYGLKKGLRGRFAMYVPPLMEELGLAELEHNPRNNRIRAVSEPTG